MNLFFPPVSEWSWILRWPADYRHHHRHAPGTRSIKFSSFFQQRMIKYRKILHTSFNSCPVRTWYSYKDMYQTSLMLNYDGNTGQPPTPMALFIWFVPPIKAAERSFTCHSYRFKNCRPGDIRKMHANMHTGLSGISFWTFICPQAVRWTR